MGNETRKTGAPSLHTAGGAYPNGVDRQGNFADFRNGHRFTEPYGPNFDPSEGSGTLSSGVERSLHTRQVSGSIPLASTTPHRGDVAELLADLMTPDEHLTMGRIIRDIALILVMVAATGLLGGLVVGGLVGSMLMGFSADPVSTYWTTVGWAVVIGMAGATAWAISP